MAILVVGGAGYIGSHTVKYLIDCGEDVIVYDNLRTGHMDMVDSRAVFYRGDIRDELRLEEVFSTEKIEAVVHFAACSIVSESMKSPYEYYDNNVGGLLSLLNVMKKYKCKKIVFSSSAAVYGEPENIPIEEKDNVLPKNPYGETKLAMEKMMKWFDAAYEIGYVALRYFNAAGAHPSGKIGERHAFETHLIPIILNKAIDELNGIKTEAMAVYGNDYSTRDGSCIRDYVHVMDLARAHFLALKYLRAGGKSEIFNLGSGKGYSVFEVLEAARRITQARLEIINAPRRVGDPAILIASYEKALKTLKWEPIHSDIDEIIMDAYRWHKNESLLLERN